MSINIGPAASDDLRPRITVIGIGGAGGNAIANMIASEIEGVDFIVANTDAQALSSSPAEKRVQLGTEITKGLGAGAKPEVGKAAAEETVKEIEEALQGVNMVFIAAGMGGGTGTGAAPVIAETARRMGVLTVGVVTKPFLFEGTRRMRAAEAGIADLQQHVDTLIVIPNQNLFLIASQDTTFKQAFEMADEVLQQGVRSITDLMVMPGLINLDFADVRSVMSEMGKAMMGTGEAEGENRAKDAAEQAIANPLLDGVSMQGAKGVIISIIGGEDMKLFEVDGAANHIRGLVDEDANIIWGSAFNPDLDGKIRVSVVATGIDQSAEGAPPRPAETAAGAAALSGVSSMPSSRAPQRPVLDLMGEAEAPEPKSEAVFKPVPEPEPEEDTASEGGDDDAITLTPPEPDPAPITLTPPETSAYEDDDAAEVESDEGVDFEPEEESATLTKPSALFAKADADESDAEEDERSDPDEAKPFDLSGMQAGDDMGELEDEDVDEIIDPLAGLRGAEDEPFDLAGSEAPEEDAVYSEIDEAEGAEDMSEDESKANGEAETAEGSSTLFERMANLSRSSGRDEDEDDDDDDDAPALSIPRFLGRQNNQ
ncbi:MAG: cell division protein FtsZ [Erythrobacter sp.]|uniref:cell division protein FtsZ n=1 Tax=Erythrobacter sp. TaxID=1042 RepID=UPI002637D093|nr:cell division protein FtsZ [Erythrobacter sp.]MDJ0979916.1 cell division protein FtsZ [Erythrobacter sp.]